MTSSSEYYNAMQNDWGMDSFANHSRMQSLSANILESITHISGIHSLKEDYRGNSVYAFIPSYILLSNEYIGKTPRPNLGIAFT